MSGVGAIVVVVARWSGSKGGKMPEDTQLAWEVVDGDFTAVACAKCANAFLAERGITHPIGENYSDESAGVYAQEDTFGQHSDFGHTCDCGVKLG